MQELQEMRIWSLSKEDPLEESMTVHSSMLAQRITWTKNPGRLQSIVSQRVRHSWNDLACKMVLIVTNFPSFSLPRNIFTKPSFLKHIFFQIHWIFFVGRYLLFVFKDSGRHWFVWSLTGWNFLQTLFDIKVMVRFFFLIPCKSLVFLHIYYIRPRLSIVSDNFSNCNWKAFENRNIVSLWHRKEAIAVQYIQIMGLPWWLSGKESACQCKRQGFDPWISKIPWGRKMQPPEYSCLEVPWTKEPGVVQSMGIQKQLNKS